jgi:hypothetical protein
MRPRIEEEQAEGRLELRGADEVGKNRVGVKVHEVVGPRLIGDAFDE